NVVRAGILIAGKSVTDLPVRGFALEHLPVLVVADEFAVAHLNLAADRDSGGFAFDWPAFKSAVVDIHLLRFRRDVAAVGGIVNHQVGVAAELDCSLAREEAEDFRGLRAGGIDEAM